MQRHADPTLGVDPLAHLEAQPARHEGNLLAVAQIVEIGAIAARDLQHIPKALGGDQRGLRACPLGDRVDHRRPAVDEIVHRVRVETGLVDGIQHAAREIVRRAESLGDAERTGLLIEVDEIREGPADIGRQSAHRMLLPVGSSPIIHRRGRGSNRVSWTRERKGCHAIATVCRGKAPSLSGCESRPATVAPAGSNRSGRWR